MAPTDWLQVKILVNFATKEAVMNFFFEIGCIGCQEEQDLVTAYFHSECSEAGLKAELRSFLQQLSDLGLEVSSKEFELSYIKNQDWNAEWKKHFKPIDVTNRFIIKPTWENLQQESQKYVLNIDPKQAFGTGTHATTQIMLKLLEQYVQPAMKILDAGTGTGILAIASAKLGAKVTAFDNDALSTEAAMENIELNNCKAVIKLFCGEIGELPFPDKFDIILANINRNVILSLIPIFHGLMNDAGFLILSGILEEEGETVRNHIKEYSDWQLLKQIRQDEWLGFVFGKEPTL